MRLPLNEGRINMAFTYKKTITDFLPHFPNIINMTFNDVILKFYPLVADIGKLQDFCDLYLNFKNNVDPPPFYFKAALPFVLLQLIDYPRMQQGKLWMRSREVIFGIPIEWYARDSDKLHFRDWGLTFRDWTA